MKQTKLMSLVEAIANVVVGYGIAVLTQLVVFPWFGLPARIGDALAIGAVFTAVSIARSFALRRLFEGLRVRSGFTAAQGGGGSQIQPKSNSDVTDRSKVTSPMSKMKFIDRASPSCSTVTCTPLSVSSPDGSASKVPMIVRV